MGLKNLKAIAVRGSKPVQLADPERFKRICDEVLEESEKGRLGVRLFIFIFFWQP